jgi:Autographiviridae endonuclease VII
MKRCLHCGLEKPLDHFYVDSKARDGRRPECKSCNLAQRRAAHAANPDPGRARARQWQRDNPERYAAKQREYAESGRKAIANRKSHLKRKYGLSVDEYDAMLDAQGGVCAICGEKPGDLTLHVDHDHATGALRRLLCVRCNNALGCFQESHDLFQAAAEYLDRFDPGVVELAAAARERARALSPAR